MPDFPVPPTCSPLPVKEFLRRQAGISLTLWRKIKHSGTLSLNGCPAATHDLVYPGDIVTATWPQATTITAEALPLAIAYEDEWLLAADKPAGMLVHPAAGQPSGTLANAVMHYYRQNNYACDFHPVNRLDRNTSGLVLIAKRPDIQHWLNQNQQHLLKTYLAAAAGRPQPDKGTLNMPIGRKPGSIIERQVTLAGQQAITHYNLLAAYKNASLLEIILATGRTHQIRVHFSHIGCPLLGDDLYGGPVNLIQRQALHAASLSLLHPITQQITEIISPLPQDLTDLLSQLGDQVTNML
ncbi:RluA family pseudouridine synthase [Sporomusa termitida]|uniref:Pseudouridine synthase n=1 Tax=Sporomusa termitida TaxID=2377 RepID=A0A517DUT5_9FIRM|nr:RluA family pseudouridine synthase [Sporomusa termitida]QDR81122.1 pseudouridine synthase, RluA family [Sporomusa termitida]